MMDAENTRVFLFVADAQSVKNADTRKKLRIGCEKENIWHQKTYGRNL